MTGYLSRLLRSGAAYQVAAALSAVIALVLLPLYTRYLTRADYGLAELVLVIVLSLSILVRLGVIEAFVRLHFLDEDAERRRRLAGTALAVLLAGTTALALLMGLFADPLSELLFDRRDGTLVWLTALGVWAFTNLEGAYALLRVEERRRIYLIASLSNVALTVGLTIVLVVGLGEGAQGYVLGNYGASAVVLLALWVVLRDRLARPAPRRELGPMLRFGLPTVPAELSVFALNVVDRFWVARASGAAALGLYSLAAKLAGVIILVVRAFQYAWPPLAYSVRDDEEAARLYAVVATYYVLATGLLVTALTLLGRWVLRVFAAPDFFGAHVALPWLALGWALYGLYLVLVVAAGRARVTSRNFPAALAGLVVNVAALALLVGPLGIAGAGIALAVAYVVMIAVLFALTRRVFPVAFEWGRLARVVGALAVVAVGGELLLPETGAAGLLSRLAALALTVPVLAAVGFLRRDEIVSMRRLLGRRRR